MPSKLSSTVIVLLLLHSTLFGQKLIVGTENGINFSNINGDLRGGKWNAQPGPVNGVFAKYKVGKSFMLQSGVSFATHYYNRVSQQYYYPGYYYSSDFYFSSSSITSYPDIYPYSNWNWKYSFLRVPFLFKYKTDGRLNFEIGTGAYYSFMVNDEFTGRDKDFYPEEYMEETFPPSNDWGWLFSAGVNYEITDRLEVSIAGLTSKGKEAYIEEVDGKNGSTEITFGLGYKLFPGKNIVGRHHKNDSIQSRLTLLPHAGVIFSTTANPTNKEHYLSSSGFTSGMSLKIQLDNTVSVVTGAWYERKGYGLDYVGTEKFIYVEPNNESTSSYVNTETDLDYLTFPFLFEFKIGRRFSANMNFGFYYSILQNAMVRGDYIYTNSGGGSYSVQKEYINDKMVGWFKNSDVGVLSGIRFEYPVFTNTNVFLGINYANGFKNVLDINETDFPSFGRNQKIINSSFSTMFGISFSTHKSDIL